MPPYRRCRFQGYTTLCGHQVGTYLPSSYFPKCFSFSYLRLGSCSIRIRPLMSCFRGNLLLLNVSNQVYSLELPGLNEALPLSTNRWVLHNNLDWERYLLLPNLGWQDFVNSRITSYKVAWFTQSYIGLGVRNKLVRHLGI